MKKYNKKVNKFSSQIKHRHEKRETLREHLTGVHNLHYKQRGQETSLSHTANPPVTSNSGLFPFWVGIQVSKEILGGRLFFKIEEAELDIHLVNRKSCC